MCLKSKERKQNSGEGSHQTRSSCSCSSEIAEMEKQGHGGSSSSSKRSSNNGGYGSGYLDTSKAERAMWLMKCPPLVSRSLSAPPSDPSRPLAKVVVSIDPLNSSDANDDSPPQVTTLPLSLSLITSVSFIILLLIHKG